MQMLKTQWSDTRWRRALAFCAGALVLFYMVCPVAPQRWADLYAQTHPLDSVEIAKFVKQIKL